MMTMPPQTFDLRKNPTVSEITVYTVAAEGEANPENFDFADLEAALTFAERADMVGAGAVALELADGTHYFRRNPKQPSVSGNGVAAYNFNQCQVYLSGANKESCILTFDPNLEFGSYGYLFRFIGGKLSAVDLTIDLSNKNNSSCTAIRMSNLFLVLENAKFISAGYADGVSNGYGIFDDGESLFNIKSSFGFFGFSIGYLCSKGGSTGVIDAEFIDSGYYDSLIFQGESSLNIENGSVYTFYDGNYIAVEPGSIAQNGLVRSSSDKPPMYFAGWTGTTADRPTLQARPYAQPYFDTDLGYPIWWNGTAWVDATGTEV